MSEYILIADSGSTKTDWTLLGGGETLSIVKTQGINPFQMLEQDIVALLNKELLPHLHLSARLGFVYFYGAGCIGDKREMVERALCAVLNPEQLEVQSDIMAAARALLGKSRGIACILGTGANSCLYDGERIVKSISPLGYVLGDEGSGAVLGKRLLSDVLKRQMPEELCEAFQGEYDVDTAEVLHKVYKEPFANRYLASFVPFLSKYQGEAYVSALLDDEFTKFFVRNIKPYNEAMLPVGFVGSIAYVFRAQLAMAAERLGFVLGEVLKSPSERLVEFHRE